MNTKAQLRRLFDKAFSSLPTWIHTGLLKSYANQPELTLRSRFRCYPQTFYSPLVDPAEIDISKLGQKRELPGIRFDMSQIEELVEALSKYAPEFSWAPRDPETGFVEWAETYTTIDSIFLYCMVRHLKPKHYIEVGCGKSSGVSSMALRANDKEGFPATCVYIEPYPGPRLEGIDLYGELLVKKIEELPLEFFQKLEPGDILFIDTSHVIKCQNDVEWEYVHVLPGLNPGVHIHIHDIYTPYEQPHDWLLGRYAPGFANEQYIVEALLSGGKDFEVTLPLHLFGRERPDLISKLLQSGEDRGQAIWIRKAE